MKKITVCILIINVLLVSSLPSKSQLIPDDDKDDLLVVGANVAFNALLGGLGSKIHKQTFWKGFKEGALGGLLIGTGKYMVGKNYDFGWPSKITTAFGTSIVENTVKGDKIFQTLGMDFGPLYFELNKSSGSYKFVPEFWLGSAVAIGISIAKSDYFDWKTSLATGSVIFVKNDVSIYGMTGIGAAISNVVWIPENAKETITLSHEIIHTYQTVSIAPVGSLYLSARGQLDAVNRWHLREEEDWGTFLVWFPETMLIPNDKMPREYEGDALVDYFPTRAHKRIWEK